MNPRSIRARFLISFVATGLRSALSFLAGLLIARSLGPAGYGDLMFLIGVFFSLRSILTLGTTNAFYTFISQRPRPRAFYAWYYAWMGLQFCLPAFALWVLPSRLWDRLWLGHTRDLVFLVFAATFLQHYVWQTATQIGESSRQTLKVQLGNIAVAAAHLGLAAFLHLRGRLCVASVCAILIAEYASAAALLALSLNPRPLSETGAFSARAMLSEYWRYCRSLLLSSAVGFSQGFGEKWLLQRFSGAVQQGFYQISAQFANISLLATSSILNIYWKEIAEAHAANDKERLSRIYHRAGRSLVLFAAAVSGILIPWSKEIVGLTLGPAYAPAWPILALMLLFPVHQSMGQVGGSTLLACGHTHAFMLLTVSFTALALMSMYAVLAPLGARPVPGLGLGARGMAFQAIAVNILTVNAQAWVLSRLHGWRYDWRHQFEAVGGTVLLGWAAKTGAVLLLPSASLHGVALAWPMGLSALLYAPMLLGLLWLHPAIAASSREELRHLARQALPRRRI